jgi:hypothetical protein
MSNATQKNTTRITGSLSAPPTIKINIATPSYGSTYSGAYVRTLYKVLSTGPKNRVSYSFSDIDYADVVTARNYLISNFYFNKPDCSHILFIDDDMGFEASLIYEMLNLKKDFIGVIAPKRKIDLKKLHSLSNQSYSKALALSCEFVGTPKTVANDKNFVEVSSCGGGILLLTRECIKTMVDKCPDIIDSKKYIKMPFGSKFSQFITPFNKIQLEDKELSEDLSFAYRWTNICNGKIYASISSNIQHMTEITLETKYGDLS